MAATTSSEAMKNRTKQFALVVFRLCRSVARTEESRIVTRQLLRSATSVSGELPCSVPSAFKPDLFPNWGIVLEEADESLLWLELLVDTGAVPADRIRLPLGEANELVSIFVASLRT